MLILHFGEGVYQESANAVTEKRQVNKVIAVHHQRECLEVIAADRFLNGMTVSSVDLLYFKVIQHFQSKRSTDTEEHHSYSVLHLYTVAPRKLMANYLTFANLFIQQN